MATPTDLYPVFTTSPDEAGKTGDQFSQLFGIGTPPAEVAGVTKPAKLPRDISINLNMKSLGRELEEGEDEDEEASDATSALRRRVGLAGGSLNNFSKNIFELTSNSPSASLIGLTAPTDVRSFTTTGTAASQGIQGQDLMSLVPDDKGDMLKPPTDLEQGIGAVQEGIDFYEGIPDSTKDYISDGIDWIGEQFDAGADYLGIDFSSPSTTQAYNPRFSTGIAPAIPQASQYSGYGAQTIGSIPKPTMPTTMGSVGYGQTSSAATSMGSKALGYAGTALGLYGGYQQWQSGDKIGGALTIAATFMPPLQPFAFAYSAIKGLFGGGLFGGGKEKPPMGGVEYRVTSTDIMDQYRDKGSKTGIPSDTDQSAWLYPGSDAWNQAMAEDKLRITAPYSWGYNGFEHNKWKNASQRNIDYMYAFADEFDLNVNEDVFYRAALGTGGLEKFKPSGDRKVSWLERVDSIGNGAPNANGWLQAVFEYTGPGGERIIEGDIYKGVRIDPNTGMPVRVGYKDQKSFESAVNKFNEKFWGAA